MAVVCSAAQRCCACTDSEKGGEQPAEASEHGEDEDGGSELAALGGRRGIHVGQDVVCSGGGDGGGLGVGGGGGEEAGARGSEWQAHSVTRNGPNDEQSKQYQLWVQIDEIPVHITYMIVS